MLNGPFSPWPSYSKEEQDAVSEVLSTNQVNYWTGQTGQKFEEEFAEFAGSQFAIAVANGTVALDLALQGLKIGSRNGGSKFDEVIVTARSYIASVSSIVNAGAVPVFADVGLISQNIEPTTVEPKVTEKTRAILCVHLAGLPCDMDGFKDLLGDRDIALIEDCAQAHGALYKGQPVGSLGTVAAWSFCQDKIMTTGGEGGMVTTSDPDLWARMWAFKDHGKSYDAVYKKKHPNGFRWVHESFGTNWRLTELQSAIGRIQLKKMPVWQRKRQHNADLISSALSTASAGTNRIWFSTSSDLRNRQVRHAWYKYYAFVEPKSLKEGWSRDRIVHEIVQAGVPCFQGSCSEIYLEKAFEGTSFRPKEPLLNSRTLGNCSIMLLVHPTLTEEEITKTCSVVSEVLIGALR